MTDHYSVCETALLVKVATLTGYFTAKQIAASDDTIIGLGHDYYAVAYPGGFSASQEATGLMRLEWTIYLDLYVRYKTEKTTWERVKALRSDVLNLLNTDRTLNANNAIDVIANAAEDPQYFVPKNAPNGPPAFVMQRLSVAVTQIVNRS